LPRLKPGLYNRGFKSETQQAVSLREGLLSNKTNFAAWQALLAAFFFGISTPLSKLVLVRIEPLLLAALLYIGSGIGLAVLKLILDLSGAKKEVPLEKTDIPWITGSVLLGGVAAPVLLLFSLKYAAASMASLLLSFEAVFTAIIAMFFFNEKIGKRAWAAVIMVTAGGILIPWQGGFEWKGILPQLGVIGACLCWSMDNNFTRKISGKDPVIIAIIKGFGAGAISLILAAAAGSGAPALGDALIAMLIGFVCYGLSVMMLILSFRYIGAARGATIFGTSPLAGVALSILLLNEKPGLNFYIAMFLMASGTVLLLMETKNKTSVL
jgi:drug/metabolite transporter (DMT)-like permease